MARNAATVNRTATGYALSNWLFGRCLGAVFLIAFWSLRSQLTGLVGQHGLVPVAEQLAQLRQAHGSDAAWLFPSLAWWDASDALLNAAASFGLLASLLVLVGWIPLPSLLACTLTYVSLANVGGPFTRFQWDSLLIETGFASLLASPWVLWHRPRNAEDPPPLARWVLYALLAKLVFLSGWAKLASGDPSWRHLTALTYHYETQPLPNPLAYFASHLPVWFHELSALAMFAIELGLPLVMLVPLRVARRTAAAGIAALMLLIMLSGNYGFFNLLACALCVPLLDDAWLARVIPGAARPAEPRKHPKRRRLERVAATSGTASAALLVLTWTLIVPGSHPVRIFLCLGIALTCAGHALALFQQGERHGWRRHAQRMWAAWRCRAIESLAVCFLLASGLTFVSGLSRSARVLTQRWLSDVSGLEMFNSYGLFAVMTKRRREIILEGSRDGAHWQSYEFFYKPGPLDRAPPVLFGHMPRLDWQMWFAALGSYRQNPWLIRLMERLLEGQPEVLQLLSKNPFPEAPPRSVRAVIYDYHFTSALERDATGHWWRRDTPEIYVPALRSR